MTTVRGWNGVWMMVFAIRTGNWLWSTNGGTEMSFVRWYCQVTLGPAGRHGDGSETPVLRGEHSSVSLRFFGLNSNLFSWPPVLDSHQDGYLVWIDRQQLLNSLQSHSLCIPGSKRDCSKSHA